MLLYLISFANFAKAYMNLCNYRNYFSEVLQTYQYLIVHFANKRTYNDWCIRKLLLFWHLCRFCTNNRRRSFLKLLYGEYFKIVQRWTIWKFFCCVVITTVVNLSGTPVLGLHDPLVQWAQIRTPYFEATSKVPFRYLRC